jgi:hypothetical protein
MMSEKDTVIIDTTPDIFEEEDMHLSAEFASQFRSLVEQTLLENESLTSSIHELEEKVERLQSPRFSSHVLNDQARRLAHVVRCALNSAGLSSYIVVLFPGLLMCSLNYRPQSPKRLTSKNLKERAKHLKHFRFLH